MNATGAEPYFRDDIDRIAWLRLLVRACEQRAWRCRAFCQVTTHVHALLEVPDLSLPRGMQVLNAEYSRDHNDRHGRVGQFVRGRYGSRRIKTAKSLVDAYVYVVLNAVEAGLCPRPEDWRWCSYATTIGLCSDFAFVDAAPVIAEAGGTVADLRSCVEAKLEARSSRRDMSGL